MPLQFSINNATVKWRLIEGDRWQPVPDNILRQMADFFAGHHDLANASLSAPYVFVQRKPQKNDA